jgi:uncharacterized protein (DUF58 family)
VQDDPRIHVSLSHLRSLEGAARGLSFLPRQPSASSLNGRHASRLRGRGLNFEELRTYLPGDDIRSIDWKASARTGETYVRVFTEERDRPALLVIDQRMSMFYGSVMNLKSVTAAEAAAISAFQILGAGDRVGGIVFDDDRQEEFVPKRGRRTVFALLEAVAAMNQQLNADRPHKAVAGSLNKVLESVVRLAHHDHLVLVFSDFDGIDDNTHRWLTNIARHNDLILMMVYDPSARKLDQRHSAIVGDGARQAEIDFSDPAILEAVSRFSSKRLDRILDWQTSINLSVLPLSAGEETLPQIQKLMGATAPRRRIR